MNARVALSAALLLALLLSPSDQADVRVKRRADPPWKRQGGASPPGLQGGGPPGLQGGLPPGLQGGLPPGLSKHKKGQGRPNPNLEGDDERPDRISPGGGTSSENVGGSQDWGQQPGSGQNQNGCRRNEFQCGSNECLPASVRCDNKFDCRDSSDEANCATTTENEAGCVLPPQPEGGSYELGGCGKPCSRHPGDKVPRNSILTYTCRDNYILNGNTITVCVNDAWYNPPTCSRTCPPLTSSSVDISCTYQGTKVSCTDRILPGTRATLSCKPSYKLPLTNDPAYRELTCLDDGLWDRRIFRCLPECGTATARGNTLIVNGYEAKAGVFPWHVGIYSKKSETEYEQICGGTLISNNIVVSAAHCFYDEVYNKLTDKSHFGVAAGKHYRDWNANENYAQKSSVAELSLPDRYLGARGNFAQDIALIKLETPFELTALVRPICMDWDNTYEREQLQVGQRGKAVGWGKTLDGEPSEILQELDMPYVPYDQCLSAVPSDFRGYITSDKFCAGWLNGSSLCDGDSGGGLCFNLHGTWYLRGIVSVSPVKDNRCDYNSYVAFTYVSYFRDWLRAAYLSA